MLRDQGVAFEASWTVETGLAGGCASPDARDAGKKHEQIDRELRRIAKRRAGLDVDEARWLREAERYRIWRKLGYATALEYLEDVFGYAPRTAKDRLRVAKELGQLPQLEADLRSGALPYSAARELTRVMTRQTESQWLAHARGKNVHDIQALVAGHKKGNTPDDDRDPDLMTRDVTFELDSRRQALLQQVRAMFEAERGEHIDGADLIEAMCMRVLRGEGHDCQVAGPASGNPTCVRAPTPAHRIVIRRCDQCSRAWQQGRGALFELTTNDLELAECDAEVVRGSELVAAEAAGKRGPAPTLSIPKKTRDLVMARDQGRCRFPGCRAVRHVAIHHIVQRAHGGGHEAPNLIVLCDGHHKLLHDGLISISGRAPDELVFMRSGTRLVDARAPSELQADAELRVGTARTPATGYAAGERTRSRFDHVVKLEQATQALRQLGFKTRAAKAALEQASAHVGTDADVAALVHAVLAFTRTEQLEGGDPATPMLAKQALVQSGFASAVAERAVAAARAHVSTDVDLAAFIKEALRHCR